MKPRTPAAGSTVLHMPERLPLFCSWANHQRHAVAQANPDLELCVWGSREWRQPPGPASWARSGHSSSTFEMLQEDIKSGVKMCRPKERLTKINAAEIYGVDRVNCIGLKFWTGLNLRTIKYWQPMFMYFVSLPQSVSIHIREVSLG